MESVVKIKFKKISGIKVDDNLLKMTPQLPDVTKKTMKILCEQIVRYFRENKIEVEVDFELK